MTARIIFLYLFSSNVNPYFNLWTVPELKFRNEMHQ